MYKGFQDVNEKSYICICIHAHAIKTLQRLHTKKNHKPNFFILSHTHSHPLVKEKKGRQQREGRGGIKPKTYESPYLVIQRSRKRGVYIC
jgi:hypothetical protein